MLLDNVKYREDLDCLAKLPLPWDKLKGRCVLISGATGMVGRLLIDMLMYKNQTENFGCKVYAVGRSLEKTREKFPAYLNDERFQFICHDINEPFRNTIHGTRLDYILHLASNTHPVAYATDPIGTITANVIGTQNLLDLSKNCNVRRFLFASSVEIYGENRGDKQKFDERYCGYIDCNTLRAGYNESKRCGEALCQAYIRQTGVDAVIVRLPRLFGPTMQQNDSKAIAQFIKKAVANEDILLKSDGNQIYSYSYVADAVSGIMYVLLLGKCGEAYNIADDRCVITLKELAEVSATAVNRKVVYDIPDAVEQLGYSNSTKAILDGGKIKMLGWHSQNELKDDLKKTITILRECAQVDEGHLLSY